MPLADKLKNLKVTPKRTGPLWRGPEQDGITFSLLSRWLCCRERFRLLVVDGLRPERGWNHRTGYGDLWHVCEEAHAAYAGGVCWPEALKEYAEGLLAEYPMEREHVAKWYEVCKLQFPLYVDYWAKHPDTVARKPLLSEQVFDVSYALPSGRKVRLRGKWDSVDLVSDPKPRVWLQENKTKGNVDERQIVRQLTFDLQTMMYLVALRQHRKKKMASDPIAGVRYNVVRRPLSGGKGTIVQKEATKGAKCKKCDGAGRVGNPAFNMICSAKGCVGGRVGAKRAETAEEYYARLAEYIKAEPETYFFRWNVEITNADIDRFERECLKPVLEQLCDWWRQVSTNSFVKEPDSMVWAACGHWRHPFGVYNALNEGGSSDYDAALETGSTAGLVQVETLFKELE